jgi:hypothetical protein
MLLFYEQNNITAFKQILIDQFEFTVNTYFRLNFCFIGQVKSVCTALFQKWHNLIRYIHGKFTNQIFRIVSLK